MNEENTVASAEEPQPAPVLANPATEEAASAPAAPELAIGSQVEPPAVRLPSKLRGKIQKDGSVLGTGRRKTAVARVRVRQGSGKISVNGREFAEYFPVERHRLVIEAPLHATGLHGKLDMTVQASGGGVNGQAGAIVLGIARAIQALNPELHGVLSDGGYLTRDDRMVERKKYGHKKARRSFQFSKR